MNKKAFIRRPEEIFWWVVIMLVALFAFKVLIGFGGTIETEKIPMDAVESVQELQSNYENCTRLLANRDWQIERYSNCEKTIFDLEEIYVKRLNTSFWILIIFAIGFIAFLIAWFLAYERYRIFKTHWSEHQAQYICKLRKKYRM